MTAPSPLTLIVEGKPLVFDVPVPVGEVIPAGTWSVEVQRDGSPVLGRLIQDWEVRPGEKHLTARPPVAPESFADGDVAWVRVERAGLNDWRDGGGRSIWSDVGVHVLLANSNAFMSDATRPESLADVLDDLGLTDEQRARVEKAVGGR